jgi:hypothetical protein
MRRIVRRRAPCALLRMRSSRVARYQTLMARRRASAVSNHEAPPLPVVPANAGTHNHRGILLKQDGATAMPDKHSRWLSVLVFGRTMKLVERDRFQNFRSLRSVNVIYAAAEESKQASAAGTAPMPERREASSIGASPQWHDDRATLAVRRVFIRRAAIFSRFSGGDRSDEGCRRPATKARGTSCGARRRYRNAVSC